VDNWLQRYIEASFGEVSESLTLEDTWHITVYGVVAFDDLVSLNEECESRGYNVTYIAAIEVGCLCITIIRRCYEQC
jgi:hypothetical protein